MGRPEFLGPAAPGYEHDLLPSGEYLGVSSSTVEQIRHFARWAEGSAPLADPASS